MRIGRFFSTHSLKSYGSALVYVWEPFALGRPIPHPAYSYLLKGDVGHISLEFKRHGEKATYLSVWPEPDESDRNQQDDAIKKAKLSACLQDDIKEEDGRDPAFKSLDINETEYQALEDYTNAYRKKTKVGGAQDGGEIWGIKTNCADVIYDALRSANLIVALEPKIFPRTPQQVFKLAFDRQEITISKEMNQYRGFY